MADYNSDRTGSNIDLTLDKVDALDAKVQPIATGANVTGTLVADGLVAENSTNSTVTLKSTKNGVWTTDEVLGKIDFYSSDTSGSGASNKVSLVVESKDIYGAAFDLEIKTDNGLIGPTKTATFANNGDVSFYEDTGTTAKMVWSSSAESLGIGTSIPTAALDVRGSAYFISTGGTRTTDTPNGNGVEVIGGATNNMLSYNRTSASYLPIRYRAGVQSWEVNNTERARIDSSGNLLVGKTALDINVIGHQFLSDASGDYAAHTSQDTRALLLNRKVSDGEIVDFRKDGTTVGSIGVTGSTTSYNTSSDERLKENIQNTTHTVDINDIRVREFDWKAGGEHQRFGFIAQELETVYPEAVHSPEDPKEMKSVDYSKLVPLLVKEIQTLKARIEELEK